MTEPVTVAEQVGSLLGELGEASRERQHLTNDVGSGQCLPDGLRSLGEEQAELGPGRATGEPPRRADPVAPLEEHRTRGGVTHPSWRVGRGLRPWRPAR